MYIYPYILEHMIHPIHIYIWVCLYVIVYISEPMFVLLISSSCISLCHADICFATRAVILLLYVQFADRSHQTVLPNCTIRKEREPWQSDKDPSFIWYVSPSLGINPRYVHIICGSPFYVSMYLSYIPPNYAIIINL